MNDLVVNGKIGITRYTPDELDLIKRTVCKGATDDELALFMYQVKKTGLDPLARQVYAVKRWDASQQKEVMAIQTGIDGLRLIAERHGQYAGQDGPWWCGPDGQWVDVWLSADPPAAAKVGILRSDFTAPCWGVARFEAYCAYKPKTKGGGLTSMWAVKGDIMIAKCAEALGLRKAFPQELSGLYSSEEMDNAQEPTTSAYAARKSKIWEELQAEMDAQSSAEALGVWGEKAAERVHTMPLEWQKHFREDYTRRLALLKGGLNVATPATIEQEAYDIARKRQPGEPRTSAVPYAEIINDEIPDHTADPDKYLDGLDGEMSGAKDAGQLEEVWLAHETKIAALNPPDTRAADKLYVKHNKRLGGK